MTLPGSEIKISYLTSSRFRYLTCRASNFVAFSLISLWSFIKSTFSWILDLNKRTVFNTSKHLNRQTNKQTQTSNQKKKKLLRSRFQVFKYRQVTLPKAAKKMLAMLLYQWKCWGLQLYPWYCKLFTCTFRWNFKMSPKPFLKDQPWQNCCVSGKG